MHDLTLTIAQSTFGGWSEVEVTRSMEQLAGTFQLAVSEYWPGAQQKRRILPGQPCEVYMDGDPVIKGYVDAVFPSYDGQGHSHRVEIWGREATADLVDCSAVRKGGQWLNADLLQIANDLVAPFGTPTAGKQRMPRARNARRIEVVALEDVGEPFPSASVQSGETVFEMLDRLARQRALLIWSDGLGTLFLGRRTPPGLSTTLERGMNVLAAQGEFTQRDRCSLYIIKGQTQGTDDVNGAAAAGPTARTSDSGIERYRPLMVVSDGPGGINNLRMRAAWERDVRRARGTRATYTVQGWSHTEGLWDLNTRIMVKDDWLALDEEMLIIGATYRKDSSGTRTELTLVQPDTMKMIPTDAG